MERENGVNSITDTQFVARILRAALTSSSGRSSDPGRLVQFD
jgi:hypothetical protein